MSDDSRRSNARRALLPHYLKIRKELSRAVNCPHLGADLTQQTYDRALRYYGRRAPPRNPLSWLRAIARNVTRSHFRRGRYLASSLSNEELERVLECRETPTRQGLPWDVDPEKLSRAIDSLPPTARALIQGFYFDGKSCQGLGEELGIRHPNVKIRLHRARKKLLRRLRDMGEVHHG